MRSTDDAAVRITANERELALEQHKRWLAERRCVRERRSVRRITLTR
jgi:hypothetical protein